MVRVNVNPDLEMFSTALQAALKAKSALEAERLFAGARARSIRLDQPAAKALMETLRVGGGQAKKVAEVAEQLRRQGIDVGSLRR
jgi:hypothetical protein